MRFIPTNVHGMLDYGMGLLLIISPWLFGFSENEAAMWVPVILGLGVILYSLFTDYELGLVHRISMPAHLALDAGGGLILAISPWLFGFADVVWVPHVVFGLLEIGAALMTQTRPSYFMYGHAERVPRA